MQQQRFWVITLIIVLSALGSAATDIYLPSLPMMAIYFGVAINVVQFSIVMYILGYGCGALVLGSISDRVGRKPVILFCLGVSFVGSVICSIAMDLHVLLLGRFIQGIGLSGLNVVSRSMAKDISPDQISLSKLGSILGILYAVVTALAPIIGGYIELYLNWRCSFFALLILVVVSTIVSIKKLPETNHSLHHKSWLEVLGDYWEIMTNREFLQYNIMATVAVTGMLSYQTISSSLLQVEVGLSPTQFGYTTLLLTAGLLIGGFFNSKMVVKHGINTMLHWGCSLFLISGGLLLLFGLFAITNIYTVMLPAMLFICGASITFPNASAGSMSVFAKKSGTAASVYTMVQMLGGTLGSSLMSVSKSGGQISLGVMCLVLGLIGVVVMQSMRFTTHKILKQLK